MPLRSIHPSVPPPVTVRNRGTSWESRCMVDPTSDCHGIAACTSRIVATADSAGMTGMSMGRPR